MVRNRNLYVSGSEWDKETAELLQGTGMLQRV